MTTYSFREANHDMRLIDIQAKMSHEHFQRVCEHRGQRVTLPADPIHSLPRVWFNACWNEWWKNDEDQLPWVMLKTRRELDDFVARAFLNTPKAFQDHVLNCSLPVEFPFWFKCPECDGGGIVFWSSEDGGSPPLRCDICDGRGKFREDYGSPE